MIKTKHDKKLCTNIVPKHWWNVGFKSAISLLNQNVIYFQTVRTIFHICRLMQLHSMNGERY